MACCTERDRDVKGAQRDEKNAARKLEAVCMRDTEHIFRMVCVEKSHVNRESSQEMDPKWVATVVTLIFELRLSFNLQNQLIVPWIQ